MNKKNSQSDLAWLWFDLASEATRTSFEAQEVIWRRSSQMARGTMTMPEAVGMVMEKSITASRSMQSATGVAVRGGNPLEVATAAMRPYSKKTASNAKRLRGF